MSVVWVAAITDTHEAPVQTESPLKKICAWVAANKTKRNIVAMLHRGDLVEESQTTFWELFDQAGFPVSGVPTVWTVGNHDQIGTPNLITDHLPPSAATGLVGTYAEGNTSNSYSIIDIGGRDWLVMSLQYQAPDAMVVWAGTILDAYPTTPCIFLYHSALYRDGTLSDSTKIPAQQYVGAGNYGQQLWDMILKDHHNVALVLSGHDIFNRSAYLAATGRPPTAMFPTCHFVLRNFQNFTGIYAGNPFITMIGFDYDENKLYFEEFSPPNLLDMYLPASCMTVDLVKT